MAKQPLISVIVPVYNNQEYIARCLMSIFSQTYQNIELLVINDGSTDLSENVVADLAKKDKRIKLISQTNQGVSAARNRGLKEAKGEYIMFVDGDDTIDTTTIEDSFNAIIKNGADVACFSYRMVDEKGNITYPPYIKYPEGIFFLKDLDLDYFRQIQSVWGKLFKNDGNLPLFKEDLYKNEDTLFWFEHGLNGAKICATNRVYYTYFRLSETQTLTKKIIQECSSARVVEYLFQMKSFQELDKQTRSFILQRSAYAIICEIKRFYKHKKLPAKYSDSVAKFLLNASEIKDLHFYDELQKCYLKQTFWWFDKIYCTDYENGYKKITFLGLSKTIPLSLKKIDNAVIKDLKQNAQKFERDTYLLSDDLMSDKEECRDAYFTFLNLKQKGLKAYYVLLAQTPLYAKLREKGENMENIITLPQNAKQSSFLGFCYEELLRTKEIIVSSDAYISDSEFVKNSPYWKYTVLEKK